MIFGALVRLGLLRQDKTEQGKPKVAQRKFVDRTCACCNKSHQCVETFEEMVRRCAVERNGEIILEVE